MSSNATTNSRADSPLALREAIKANPLDRYPESK
jgi:hypothetical protein